MSAKTRARRRKLKAHTAGFDRHNKGVEWQKKMQRKVAEYQRARSGLPSTQTAQ